jgi:predicted RNase H-like HicB family nuclease
MGCRFPAANTRGAGRSSVSTLTVYGLFLQPRYADADYCEYISRIGPLPSENSVYLTLEVDREADGRFIAEVTDLPGVLAYGATEQEAVARAQALALRVLADRLENGEPAPSLLPLDFRAA